MARVRRKQQQNEQQQCLESSRLQLCALEAVSSHSDELQVPHPCRETSLRHPVALMQKREPVNAKEAAQQRWRHMCRLACVCKTGARGGCGLRSACGCHPVVCLGKKQKARRSPARCFFFFSFFFLVPRHSNRENTDRFHFLSQHR